MGKHWRKGLRSTRLTSSDFSQHLSSTYVGSRNYHLDVDGDLLNTHLRLDSSFKYPRTSNNFSWRESRVIIFIGTDVTQDLNLFIFKDTDADTNVSSCTVCIKRCCSFSLEMVKSLRASRSHVSSGMLIL